MADEHSIKAMMRDASLNVAIAEDEAEALRVIMGRSPIVPDQAIEVKEKPVEVAPVAEPEVPAVVPAPAMLDFDGDDFAPGSAPDQGQVESDDDVTHYDEHEDPEQHIGEEVEYDLGSDD